MRYRRAPDIEEAHPEKGNTVPSSTTTKLLLLLPLLLLALLLMALGRGSRSGVRVAP